MNSIKIGLETADAVQSILRLFAATAFAMARPLGVAIVLPVFTRAQLGGIVRGCTAFALALPAAPFIGRLLRSVPEDTTAGQARLLMLGAKEVFVGVLIGVLVGIPIWAVQSAGELLDTQRSSTSAPDSEPGSGNQTSTMGGLLGFTTVTLFVVSGGLVSVADMIYASYAVWPPLRAAPDLGGAWIGYILGLLGSVTQISFRLAAPLVIAMLTAEAGVILLMRAVPKFNPYDMAPTLRNLVFTVLMALYTQYLLAYASGALNAAHSAVDGLRALLR